MELKLLLIFFYWAIPFYMPTPPIEEYREKYTPQELIKSQIHHLD